MIRIERRLNRPAWLAVVVPFVALAVAFAASSLVLVVTRHGSKRNPLPTFWHLLNAGFGDAGALTNTFISATPLCLTGLAAAAAFRMQLFNIGAEGQLYLGAIGSAGVALVIGGSSGPLLILSMVVSGAIAGALWALVPGILRAFFQTNEIITSLMLNYVAYWLLNYLIFDSLSYWRDTSTLQAKTFPQGKILPSASDWPVSQLGSLSVPLGFLLAIGVAAGLWLLFSRTRFGFEMQVIGDSPRAARYAGMRTRRKILAVMALSGALAGLGGASQNGDFRHQLDSRGLQQAFYGYTGIIVAALGRYNPFAVVVVAFVLGGLQNAGLALQGADFPAGLVGVIQGLILFSALGTELLVRYRVRFSLPRRAEAAP